MNKSDQEGFDEWTKARVVLVDHEDIGLKDVVG